MVSDLIRVVTDLPRVKLSNIDPTPVPGCYLQFMASRELGPPMGPFDEVVATGRYPAYAGLASKSLRERIGRYRQTIRGLETVTASTIFLAVLPCSSAASARFCEEVLIRRFGPVLNGLGWGSKVPGSRRSAQACSPVDALLPGRRWAQPASPVEVACAHLQVLANVAVRDPGGHRWDPLV